jgi:hypothetical protein
MCFLHFADDDDLNQVLWFKLDQVSIPSCFSVVQTIPGWFMCSKYGLHSPDVYSPKAIDRGSMVVINSGNLLSTY